MPQFLNKYKKEIVASCLLLTAFIAYGAAALSRYSTSKEASIACKEWLKEINEPDRGCLDEPWEGRVVVLEEVPDEYKFRVKKSFLYGGIFDERPGPPLNSDQ